MLGRTAIAFVAYPIARVSTVANLEPPALDGKRQQETTRLYVPRGYPIN